MCNVVRDTLEQVRKIKEAENEQFNNVQEEVELDFTSTVVILQHYRKAIYRSKYQIQFTHMIEEQNWGGTACSVTSDGIIKSIIIIDTVDLDVKENSVLLFKDIIFKEKVFSSLNKDFLNFTRCKFEKGIEITGFIKKLVFINCKFNYLEQEDPVVKFHSVTSDDFNFKCCTFESNVFIEHSKIGNIYIYDCKGLGNRINIYFSNIECCWVKELKSGLSFYNRNSFDNTCCKIAKMILHLHPSFDGKIEVNDANVEILEITGTNQKGTLLFSELKVLKLIKLDRFFNNSICIVYSAVINKIFIELYSSNLGKAELNNINFREVKTINIKKSNLQDLQFSNILWCNTINPKDKVAKKNFSEKKGKFKQLRLSASIQKKDFSEKREIFRQLKLSASKQMDIVSELQFYSLEMRNRHNEIWFQRGKIGDKIALSFSLITNNYGTSWLLAGLWILIISLTNYIYIKNLIFLDILKEINSGFLRYSFYEYLHSLSPFRKLDESYGIIDISKVSETVKTLDLVQRSLMALLYYQFIIAFRKYFKK